MDNPVSSLPVKRRRMRSVKPREVAPPPPVEAPPALQAQVMKRAKVLERHRRVLGEIGMQAVQTATLQVVAQQLADIQALLRANGVISMSTSVGHQPATLQGAAPPAPAGPSCAICGRPGVYQSRTAQTQGKPRPWYCAGEHAQWAQSEDGQAMQASRMMPVKAPVNQPIAPPVPAGGNTSLSGAMAALLGNEG